MGSQPHPFRRVAADDSARMVSKSFRTPEAANRTFFVHGPEPVEIPDALRLYCSLVQPDKRVVTAPLPLMSALYRLSMKSKLRGTIELMSALRRRGGRGDPSEANETLGALIITLRQWCEQQRVRVSEQSPPLG